MLGGAIIRLDSGQVATLKITISPVKSAVIYYY